MGIHSEIVASDTQAGSIIQKRTDKQIIDCIRNRGVDGPVSKGMISAMRSRLEGEDFDRSVAAIARDPVKLFGLIAEYRRIGLEEVADTIESCYGPGSEAPITPSPRHDALAELASRPGRSESWNEVLASYHSALSAEKSFGASYKTFSEEGDKKSQELFDIKLNAFITLMMYPTPSLDALAIKLAIYAGDDGHEHCDVRLFQAQMAADAVRLARHTSHIDHLLPIVKAQIERAEEHLACWGEAEDHPEFRAVVSIYNDALHSELAHV
ncbi:MULTISPECIES: hypothetical protein [unclassified Sphingomonas]|uniref:hypothetical protein n=1 Tax=unclassified Sphingomonas TaxID=196159 RepID=UPI0006F96F92|nr:MULTISPECIES: hypothetical protein [unclassified Sphingomonas]KQX18123.1 hypothetical protein ASD17_20850 [Sphingomonas sp. Root1294]KQY72678.1 hypothetical protein ASD39_17965 [Sphingomonas sp. Root50]KRB87694.1 hypothetical protein ASE22_23605 [Sphingomonas sp. Root720]